MICIYKSQEHVALNTQPRLELSICSCKVKGHLSAFFAKSKYVMLMLHFCQYNTNPEIQNNKKKYADEWVRSKSKQWIVILIA